jgi:hypothetical protein
MAAAAASLIPRTKCSSRALAIKRPKAPENPFHPVMKTFRQGESSTRPHISSFYTSEPLWVKNPDMHVTNVVCPQDMVPFMTEVLSVKT